MAAVFYFARPINWPKRNVNRLLMLPTHSPVLETADAQFASLSARRSALDNRVSRTTAGLAQKTNIVAE
jgi:hypothetical protein